jgi:hypothetical protein
MKAFSAASLAGTVRGTPPSSGFELPTLSAVRVCGGVVAGIGAQASQAAVLPPAVDEVDRLAQHERLLDDRLDGADDGVGQVGDRLVVDADSWARKIFLCASSAPYGPVARAWRSGGGHVSAGQPRAASSSALLIRRAPSSG